MDVTLVQALDGTPSWLAPLVLLVSYLDDYGGIFLAIGIYLLIIGRGPRRRAGVVILAALLMVLIVVDLVLKPLVHRPRPFQVLGVHMLIGRVPSGYSFPSGHTAAAFAGAVAWLKTAARTRLGRVVPIVFAVVVGWSRIYLGAHWPSDVLAGALVGALLGYLAARVVPASLGGAR